MRLNIANAPFSPSKEEATNCLPIVQLQSPSFFMTSTGIDVELSINSMQPKV